MDIIILAVVGLIVGLAAGYIIRAKKNGAKCIGCPYANQCGGNCSENDKQNKK